MLVSRPNIVLINLDDASSEVMSPGHINQRFPNLSQLVREGLHFSNLHATTPLCGPSRACLFRGQYAHNTGIRINTPEMEPSCGFDGGWDLYQRRGFMDNDLGVWVKNSGYRTMLVGRYLNGGPASWSVPPGWDDFFFYLGGSYYETPIFSTRTDPSGAHERLAPGVYRTTAEGADAVQLVQNHVDSGSPKPFFLYLAPLAPHTPAINSLGGAATEPYNRWWSKAPVPDSPEINELDFSDKSSAINGLDLLSPRRSEFATNVFRDQLRTIRSFDDTFGDIMRSLEANQLLDNTYIIVTSDNGFHLGHKRLIGKGTSFDRSTRVPLYVMGPDIPRGATANHLLAHIDITATVLELAGASPGIALDGKSFAPLLKNPGAFAEEQWRDPVLIENWELTRREDEVFHRASTALRFYDSIYAEWADGSSEYYDLNTDPHQLENTYESLPALEKHALRILLRQAKSPVAPETSIALPHGNNQLIPDDFALTGLAEDDLGVDRVMLTIRDAATYEFWDGSGWSPNFTRVQADVTNPGHQISTWRYTGLPPRADRVRKLYVWARTYDETGEYDPQASRKVIRIEPLRPEGIILSPAPGQQVSSRLKIRGTIPENHEIDSVWLVIRRQADQKYWDGTEWSSEWTIVLPEVGSADWSYDVQLERGDYFISSRLWNSFGIVQNPPATCRFSVIDD